jgi:hypothetical protein
VTKWIRRFEDTGNAKRKVGSGRVRETLPTQDAKLFMAVAARLFTTIQELKVKIKGF